MTKNQKRAFAFFLTCAMLLTSGMPVQAKSKPKVPTCTKKITVTQGSKKTIKVKKKKGIKIKKKSFKTTNKKIATVTKKGVVKERNPENVRSR